VARGPGRIETVKAVTATEPCYAHLADGADHADYAYPVSLLIESFGQSAALLWLSAPGGGADGPGDGPGQTLLFVGARDYEVHGHAFPGDVVRHVVRLERVVAGTAFATGESRVGDRRIATVGTVMAARRPTGALDRPSRPQLSGSSANPGGRAGRDHPLPEQENRHG
jgi:3-hydroxyacyl-[acyl-carrier-protein] dehydratase